MIRSFIRPMTGPWESGNACDGTLVSPHDASAFVCADIASNLTMGLQRLL